MPRSKTSGGLAEQRAGIAKTYKRGPRVKRVIAADGTLTEVERASKQEIVCYLRAQSFDYSYCAEAVGVSESTIKAWFGDRENGMQERMAKLREDLVAGAVRYLKTYLLEIVESLMEIARSTDSEELATKIYFDILDRVGIAKVNKSESVSANTLRQENEIALVDKTGLIAATKSAPPHVQAQMAQQAAELLALAAEHADDPGPVAEIAEPPDA